MRIIDCPTPKITTRNIEPADLIVFHWTASPGPEAKHERIRNWLKDPTRASSTHFVVMRDGSIIRAAGFDVRTWHAGGSEFAGRGSVNRRSIGIDLENVGPVDAEGRIWSGQAYQGLGPVDIKGESWEPYADTQVESLLWLVRHVVENCPIKWMVGHRDVKATKIDPGPAFPWEKVRATYASAKLSSPPVSSAPKAQ